MKRLAGMLLGAMALLILTAAPARAQYPTFNQNAWVSGGFTIQGWGGNWDDAQGYALDYGWKIHKTSKTAGALFVDFSQNWISTDFDKETDTHISGGFREFFLTDMRIQPYAHASIGNMHWSQTEPGTFSGNDLTLGGGFGVQYKFNETWAVKAQYDFWKPHENDEWNGTIKRWTFGAVYTFGGQ